MKLNEDAKVWERLKITRNVGDGNTYHSKKYNAPKAGKFKIKKL